VLISAGHKKIYINNKIRKANFKSENKEPVIVVNKNNKRVLGSRVKIHGNSVVVYSPGKPIPCGAEVWIETESEVTIE
jgi:hypothetical protein